MITPFTIDVSDQLLDDLRSRLRNTRWPERELVDDWSQGTPLGYVQDVCEYWADDVRLARLAKRCSTGSISSRCRSRS